MKFELEETIKGVSNEALLEDIRQCAQAFGNSTISMLQYEKIGRASPTGIGRRFGSWSKALHEFVIWVNSDSPNQYSQNVQTEQVRIDSSIPAVIVKHRTRREISDRQRFRILVRDGFCCKSCGRSPLAQPGIILHVDHVLPWSKGGETVDENLETKCERCNLGKRNAFDI